MNNLKFLSLIGYAPTILKPEVNNYVIFNVLPSFTHSPTIFTCNYTLTERLYLNCVQAPSLPAATTLTQPLTRSQLFVCTNISSKCCAYPLLSFPSLSLRLGKNGLMPTPPFIQSFPLGEGKGSFPQRGSCLPLSFPGPSLREGKGRTRGKGFSPSKNKGGREYQRWEYPFGVKNSFLSGLTPFGGFPALRLFPYPSQSLPMALYPWSLPQVRKGYHYVWAVANPFPSLREGPGGRALVYTHTLKGYPRGVTALRLYPGSLLSFPPRGVRKGVSKNKLVSLLPFPSLREGPRGMKVFPVGDWTAQVKIRTGKGKVSQNKLVSVLPVGGMKLRTAQPKGRVRERSWVRVRNFVRGWYGPSSYAYKGCFWPKSRYSSLKNKFTKSLFPRGERKRISYWTVMLQFNRFIFLIKKTVQKQKANLLLIKKLNFLLLTFFKYIGFLSLDFWKVAKIGSVLTHTGCLSLTPTGYSSRVRVATYSIKKRDWMSNGWYRVSKGPIPIEMKVGRVTSLPSPFVFTWAPNLPTALHYVWAVAYPNGGRALVYTHTLKGLCPTEGKGKKYLLTYGKLGAQVKISKYLGVKTKALPPKGYARAPLGKGPFPFPSGKRLYEGGGRYKPFPSLVLPYGKERKGPGYGSKQRGKVFPFPVPVGEYLWLGPGEKKEGVSRTNLGHSLLFRATPDPSKGLQVTRLVRQKVIPDKRVDSRYRRSCSIKSFKKISFEFSRYLKVYLYKMLWKWVQKRDHTLFPLWAYAYPQRGKGTPITLIDKYWIFIQNNAKFYTLK